jgi:hypothetical protein
LTSARLIEGAGASIPEIAARLRLDTGQLGWGGDGALHAQLDCPAGSWRVYPSVATALWISDRPGVDPPPARPGAPLSFQAIVPRLRRRGVRFRDLQVRDAGRWTAPVGAVEALALLRASDPSGISGVWSSADRHPVRIEAFADGTLWAPTAADVAWWAQEACTGD